MRLRFLVLFSLIIFAVSLPAWCWSPSQPCPNRAGTIEHALSQPDGTPVILDAVQVYKIAAKQSPAYFVIKDPWDCGQKIVVEFCPTQQLRLGMQVVVRGIMRTDYGMRLVKSASVQAYCDADGSIHDIGNISKSDNVVTYWPYSMKYLDVGTCPPTPVSAPTIEPKPAPHYYLNISDAKLAPDGEWVWLSNKKITEKGSDENGTYYLVAADASNDIIRIYSTIVATTTDRAWNISGLIGTHNGIRTISTDSGPDLDYWTCIPRFSIYNSGHISWSKSQPDGEYLTLPQKVITAAFPGYCYIEEPDRSAGIRLITNRPVVLGKVINIAGATITTVDGEKCLNNVTMQIASNPVTLIKPVGMTNRTLGGGNLAWENDGSTRGQIGVEGGIGLNNIGLLVRIWGKVTYVDPAKHYYIVDDGTGLSWIDAGITYTGVKIALGDNDKYLPCADEHGTAIAVGDYVEGVNGVSSCVRIDGIVYRALRQIGAFGTRGPPWWPANKINRVGTPGM